MRQFLKPRAQPETTATRQQLQLPATVFSRFRHRKFKHFTVYSIFLCFSFLMWRAAITSVSNTCLQAPSLVLSECVRMEFPKTSSKVTIILYYATFSFISLFVRHQCSSCSCCEHISYSLFCFSRTFQVSISLTPFTH